MTVLITGVSGGMGHAAAEYLTEHGCTVFGIDIADSCDLPINYISADITNADDVLNAFKYISTAAEQLDAILHFAGIYMMNSLVEIGEEEFVKIFNVNLFGMYRVNRQFFPLLHRGSRIIITSSELAPLDPLPFTGLYAVTKAAVEKYAYSLRMELNIHGIFVSVIRPGAVRTNMLGASTRALDNMCRTTRFYRYNAERFKRIVNSVETKSVDAEKIGSIAYKVLKSKRPKYVYNVNRNILLRLLNILPHRWQVDIITSILRSE